MALAAGILGSSSQHLTVDKIKKGGCKAMLDLCEGITGKFGIKHFDLYLDKLFMDDQESECDIFAAGFSLYYSYVTFLNTHIPMLDKCPLFIWDILNPKWHKSLNLLNHSINYFRSCEKDFLSWQPLAEKNKALKSKRDHDFEEAIKIEDEIKILKTFCSTKSLEQQEIINSNVSDAKIFNERLVEVKALQKKKDDYEIKEAALDEEIKKAEDYLNSLGRDITAENQKVVNSSDLSVKKRKEKEDKLNDLNMQLKESVSKKMAIKLNCTLSEKAAQFAEEQVSILKNRLNLFTTKILEDRLKTLEELKSRNKDSRFQLSRYSQVHNHLNVELEMLQKDFGINKKNLQLINGNLSKLSKTNDERVQQLAYFIQEISTKLQKFFDETDSQKEFQILLEQEHEKSKQEMKYIMQSFDKVENFYCKK